MKRLLRYSLGILSGAVVASLLIWSFLAHRAELAGEADSDQPIGSAASVTRGPSGETVVRFPPEMQKRVDIQTGVLAAVTRNRQATAYGHLEEDPARSFILRAPVAGTVRPGARPWPELGQVLPDRSSVGAIEPRLAPSDRITLADRATSAKADLASGKATLSAATAALERARTLNADNKNVSDRAVQEAEARAAAEQARVTAAAQSLELIQSALASMSSASAPLELERGGQVVEVLVHPGESVEAGQPIVRVARFDQLLARIDVPAGDVVPPDVAAAEIAPLGYEARPVRGARVALAAAVDPRSQGQPFLFRVPNARLLLRPGLAVTAYLDLPGAPRQGVVVPGAAVVRQSGRAWVYLQSAPDRFTRHEVALEEPSADGWFTASIPPGSRIVTTGAQTLLSEEFKSQIQVGEESEP
jgi:multidrug efflux pump subunit AcrA (membrane-fusion protein)